MKTIILLAAVLSFNVSTGSTANEICVVSQNSAVPTFTMIRAHRQGKAINLSWQVTSNAGVTTFDIECTYEDPNDPYAVWELKGSTPVATVKTYHFMDHNILPGTMHYRLVAHMSDGSTVTSDYETIRFASH